VKKTEAKKSHATVPLSAVSVPAAGLLVHTDNKWIFPLTGIISMYTEI
jgi:hypothetical protein